MRDAVADVEFDDERRGDDDVDGGTFRSKEEDWPGGEFSNPRSSTTGKTTLGSAPRGWISDVRY